MAKSLVGYDIFTESIPLTLKNHLSIEKCFLKVLKAIGFTLTVCEMSWRMSMKALFPCLFFCDGSIQIMHNAMSHRFIIHTHQLVFFPHSWTICLTSPNHLVNEYYYPQRKLDKRGSIFCAKFIIIFAKAATVHVAWFFHMGTAYCKILTEHSAM